MSNIPFFDDFKKLVEGWVIGLFGKAQWTDHVVSIIVVVIVIGVAVYLFSLFLKAVKGIREVWKEIIVPRRYDHNERRRQFRRRMFADHIESEIRYMNLLESWNDNRFTELEAHVETEGKQKTVGTIPFGIFNRSRVRLEKSLSDAIERSDERLVLLEGDPGAGKSVALRHVTQIMAIKARKSNNLTTRIPIYINLKYLRRYTEEKVDRNLIEKFIFRMLNRVNDRDVDEYLHDEFRRGLEDGTWFFLFDSFDEIPEILSSTGTDEAIRTYAEAIRDFLHGMNNCKGIVASREYKGPRFLGWPKFQILPLESSRRIELVEKHGLSSAIEKSILDGLALANDDFKAMASNPMFLNLICEYMNKSNTPQFPNHIHPVFQEYILKRLTRDEERVKQRFNKTPREIQSAAENIAFCMTADQAIGLSPTLEQLQKSTQDLKLELGTDFDTLIDALAYLKLARTDKSFIDGSKTFTFAHRRFQEYFATAVVLKEPKRVSDLDLVTNGRWRETTVVILQTQKNERVKAIIETSDEILNSTVQMFGKEFIDFEVTYTDREVVPQLFNYRAGSLFKYIFEPFAVSREKIKNYIQNLVRTYEYSPVQMLEKDIKSFAWPQNLYHIISILQDGLSRQPEFNHKRLQEFLDKILVFISEKGDIIDEKLCLELIGLSSDNIKLYLITKGVRHSDRYVSRVAFRRVTTLKIIPSGIFQFIKSTLTDMALNRKLFENRYEIYAQLSRLENPKYFLDFAKLFSWAFLIDLFLLVTAAIGVGVTSSYSVGFFTLFILIIIWWLTWYTGNVYALLISRTFGWLFLVGAVFSITFTSVPLFINKIFLLSEPFPQSISYWYFIYATCWMISLLIQAESLRFQPHPLRWPFYSMKFTATLFLIALVVRKALEFYTMIGIDWLRNGVIHLTPYQRIFEYIALFLIIVTLLDFLYLIPRIRIIYQETPSQYRSFEFFIYWYGKQDKVLVKNWYLFFVLSFPFLLLGAILNNDVSMVGLFVVFFAGLVYYFYKKGFQNLIEQMVKLLQDLVGSARYAYKSCQSIIRYYVWRKNADRMHFLGFLDELNLYQGTFARRLFIKDVIEKKLIIPTSENKTHLRNMISFLSALRNDRRLAGRSLNLEKFKELRQKRKDALQELDPPLFSSLEESNFSTAYLFMQRDQDSIGSSTMDSLCELFDQFSMSEK